VQVPHLVAAAVADRRLRLLAAVAFLGFLGLRAWQTVHAHRSDLLRPTDIGGDPSNYLAAGLRLLAGHPLYAMTAGDRPVPSYDPPFFTVPLLSPPTIAVPWAALGVLPPALAMSAWWLSCVAVSVLLVTVFALRAPWPLIVLALPLAGGLAIITLAGNLNAYLFAAIALTWVASFGRVGRRTEVAIGVLVGAVAALKLAPLLLVWWLRLRVTVLDRWHRLMWR